MDFLRKTYSLFMAGILTAVVAGTLCLQIPALYNLAAMILSTRIFAFVLILGLSIGAQAVSRIEGVNLAALFGFTGFMGFIVTPILAQYQLSSPGIVGQAAFLTVTLFGSLTAYVFLTKKDFSFMGGMLTVGMVSLLVGVGANILFFKSSSLGYWLAWVTVLLMSGFVLYTTSNIIHRYGPKDYVAAALSLFIEFFNMFMAILRILAGNRR
jgi:FtsH-binding integral membrane protein